MLALSSIILSLHGHGIAGVAYIIDVLRQLTRADGLCAIIAGIFEELLRVPSGGENT